MLRIVCSPQSCPHTVPLLAYFCIYLSMYSCVHQHFFPCPTRLEFSAKQEWTKGPRTDPFGFNFSSVVSRLTPLCSDFQNDSCLDPKPFPRQGSVISHGICGRQGCPCPPWYSVSFRLMSSREEERGKRREGKKYAIHSFFQWEALEIVVF